MHRSYFRLDIIYLYIRILTGDVYGTLILAAVSLVILYKHIENLRRIQMGTEAHISFLWKRDQEIERIKHNTN